MSEKDFSGLFHRQEDGQWYAITQMEPTWARRVFPCFDEPAFKVPWRLTLHIKREHTALGNAARPASNLATGTRNGEHDT